MSLSAENRAGPAFVVIDDFQPASVAPASDDTRWEGPISQKPQKSGETKDRKKPIDNERSGETAFDEAVRMKKVFKGGLKESKWVVPGLDPVKKRRARGLPGTYEEEQKKSLLFLSKDRNPVEAPETSRATTPQALTPRALTPPPAPEQNQSNRKPRGRKGRETILYIG
jgi:hypothetical protein